MASGSELRSTVADMNKIATSAIGNASDAVRKLNPKLFGGKPGTDGKWEKVHAPDSESIKKQSKRIRQDPKPLLNKLESEFLTMLTAYHPNAVIWKQALRWKLGNGIWYKPDFAAFVASYPWAGAPMKVTKLTCWEVKGPHSFRGGFENLKVAAGMYPDISWELVWKEQGEWKKQQVLS